PSGHEGREPMRQPARERALPRGGRLQFGIGGRLRLEQVAGFKSELAADFISEWVADLRRNQQVENRGGYDATRFNALRHGVLSQFTVLPWEQETEYRALLAALVAEHAPRGPTEEHLVEDLAGVIWRKRRLRLAEGAAHRRGLEHAMEPYRETVKAAL